MKKNSVRLFHNSLSVNGLERDFAFYRDRPVSRSSFLLHVNAVTRNLADTKYVINLCEDRYLFMVLFIACLTRKQVSLLPPSRVVFEIENLKKEYNNCCSVSDEEIELMFSKKNDELEIIEPDIDFNQLACIVFTSGSTGKPKANKKKWGALLESSKLAAKVLQLDSERSYHILATVPAQHMFGFEMSIMLPLVTCAQIHSAKPFFPQEICHCLSQLAQPRILITTPMHLKACSEANLEWPEIEFILSATATLDQELAEIAESVFNARVKEIYGCSEAGAIASRLVTDSALWKLLPGYRIEKKISLFELRLPGENNTIVLHDNFDFTDGDHFILHGRESDMIKIAGKRGSLGDLRNKICSIPGVNDAVFFMPGDDLVKGRTAALVVANGNDTSSILKALTKIIDPVFLPRPLIKVKKIPYNDIGKISRNKLIEILKQHRKENSNLTECAGK